MCFPFPRFHRAFPANGRHCDPRRGHWPDIHASFFWRDQRQGRDNQDGPKRDPFLQMEPNLPAQLAAIAYAGHDIARKVKREIPRLSVFPDNQSLHR